MSTLRERFYEQVNKSDGCWEWEGQRSEKGYGVFEEFHEGRRYRMRAHRLSYALENGPIPKGMLVCHHCDNPACVRPDHLFLGTHQDNANDRDAKGRGAYPKGTIPAHLVPFTAAKGTRIPNSVAAKNAAKTSCPKCGGPLVVVGLASQGNRRRCPPCTQAAKNAYLKLWKQRQREEGGT